MKIPEAQQLPLFIFFSFIAKLLIAHFVPVFGDESYYYIWSLHPQLSYFDHPPMMSWLIAASHWLLPAGHAISLRLGFVLASLATALVWVKILRECGWTDRSILIFQLLIFLNPLLGVGSVLATPDTPLVLFWTLSYWFFTRLTEAKTNQKLANYIWLGVFLGLGFCAKYHIVLFVLAGLIYLLWTKKLFQLRPLGILCVVLFGALFCSPVIIWNAQNEWASFLFQINHGFGESNFEWHWPLNYVVAQILILGPLVFLSLHKSTESPRDFFFSWTQLLFFLSSSFKSTVEANWPITSHIHANLHSSAQASARFLKFTLIYWVLAYSAVLAFLNLPASDEARKKLYRSTQAQQIWPELKDYKPLYGPSYQMASLLSWVSQENIPKLRGLSRLDFYDSLPESLPAADVFYVLKIDYSHWPESYSGYKKIKIRSFDNMGLELYQLSHE